MGRLALAVLAFGFGLGTVQATTTRRSLSEVEALIERAMRAHNEARSYQEWSESPYSPEHLSENLLSRSRTPAFTRALCLALKNQPPANLYYVNEYLHRAPISVCLSEQSRRYQEYLKSEQIKIRNLFGSREGKLGPSMEIHLVNEDNRLVIDGHLPDKTLVLTFDDGPHPTRTQALLDILAEENAQVQFFLVGQNSRALPHLIRLENQAGHEIGCHSDSHPDFRKLTSQQALNEIEDGFSAIARALDEPRTFFRFPYGAHTREMREHLALTKTPEFFWNIDSWDWKHKDPSELIHFALDQVRFEGRGVMLFHDIQPQTIAIMPGFLAALKQEGYKLAIFRPIHPRLTPSSASP